MFFRKVSIFILWREFMSPSFVRTGVLDYIFYGIFAYGYNTHVCVYGGNGYFGGRIPWYCMFVVKYMSAFYAVFRKIYFISKQIFGKCFMFFFFSSSFYFSVWRMFVKETLCIYKALPFIKKDYLLNVEVKDMLNPKIFILYSCQPFFVKFQNVITFFFIPIDFIFMRRNQIRCFFRHQIKIRKIYCLFIDILYREMSEDTFFGLRKVIRK